MTRLTLAEVAERLGVSDRTVYNWVKTGKLLAKREVREIEITRKETRLIWTVAEEDLKNLENPKHKVTITPDALEAIRNWKDPLDEEEGGNT